MRYGSVCSGIEAATVAWHPLGWQPAFFSEIDAFPCAVLNHHYPAVPNYGDMTKYQEWPDESIDLIVGGTPCQAFSVAGLRQGLADPRGNLTLTYLALIERLRPRWVVWENVPGVLSDATGAFGAFLGGLGQLGYGFSYRVLDAQYFGVPQRRRRVFVVGYFGDWRPPAAVLFERHSLRGYPAPCREAGEGFTHSIASCLGASGRGFDRPEETRGQDPVVAMPAIAGCLQERDSKGSDSDTKPGHLIPVSTRAVAPTLSANYGKQPDSSDTSSGPMVLPYTLAIRGRGDARELEYRQDGIANALLQPNGGRDGMNVGAVAQAMAVRRLTPVECERLQGFPDGYTAIPWRNKLADACPDGNRYRTLGNSMAVPCMRWIGERIQAVDDVLKELDERNPHEYQ